MKSRICDYFYGFTKKIFSYFPYSMLYKICTLVKTRFLDILISLVFLILVILGISNLFSENTSAPLQTGQADIVYTIKVEKKDSVFFESIKDGDIVFRKNSDAVSGEILSCDTVPANYITQNPGNLTFEQTEVESLFDGYIRIKTTADVLHPDLIIYNEAVKIGKIFNIRTENTVLNGYITAIEYDKELMGGFGK